MDDETKEISGYIHNISPLKGSKSTYYDMVVQTKTDVFRAVCFSPKTKTNQDLQLKSNAKSPVKISNYKVEKTNTSTTQ